MKTRLVILQQNSVFILISEKQLQRTAIITAREGLQSNPRLLGLLPSSVLISRRLPRQRKMLKDRGVGGCKSHMRVSG